MVTYSSDEPTSAELTTPITAIPTQPQPVSSCPSSPSSSSVAPNSDGSSDEKVIVAYSKLTRKKDFEISPILERRRLGLSEAAESMAYAARKIVFNTDSSSNSDVTAPLQRCATVIPDASPIDDDDDDVQVIEPINQSLEVVYDAKSSKPVNTLVARTDEEEFPINTQDISLFLAEDSQATQNLLSQKEKLNSLFIPSHSGTSDLKIRERCTAESSKGSQDSDELTDMPSSESMLCYDSVDSSDPTSQAIATANIATAISSATTVSDALASVRHGVDGNTQSEYPVGTLNPSQVRELLSKAEYPLHSQSPDMKNLLADPLQSAVSDESSTKANKTLNKDSSICQESAHGSQDEICIIAEGHTTPTRKTQKTKKKFKSPTKYIDECHQSLTADPSRYPGSSSSDSSVTSSDNGQALPSQSKEAAKGAANSSVPTQDVENVTKSNSQDINQICRPEIIMSQSNPSVSDTQSSGTVVAKASIAAEAILIELVNKQAMQREKSLESHKNIVSDDISDSFVEVYSVESPANSEQLNTNLTSVDSEQDASRKSLPSITNICKNINADDLNDPSNNTPKSETLKLTGADSRRTSTPNLGHLLPGVSPNISGEGGSYIDKEELNTGCSLESNRLAQFPASSPNGDLNRNNSTKSTLELSPELLENEESFTSVDDIRAKGGIPVEVFHLKLTTWRLPHKVKPIYVCEKGDEEFILADLPFKKKLSKSGSSSNDGDRRVSDVSNITSSSSAYQADKSSSSSSSSRRTSNVTTMEGVAKNRFSIESVQILPNPSISIDELDDKTFAVPFSYRSKSLPKHVIDETSSSDDKEVMLQKKAASFKELKAKRSAKLAINSSTILEETDVAPDQNADVIDLTTFEFTVPHLGNELLLPKSRQPTESCEHDASLKGLPLSIVSILKSVSLSEEEEELFLNDHIDMNSLDIDEEQTSMVVGRMIHAKLIPKMLVFAKYCDHFYSAVLDAKNPAGGWDLTYTLDGWQKYCPLEHILPIDILPRGQKCFRRYQGAGNAKSIVSVRVVIQGHTVENGAVLHIADDSHQAFRVPHCHLSMQLADADRYMKAWRASQSIISTGPELLLDNIIEGKRRRGQILSPSAHSPVPKQREIRKKSKKKPDPLLDSSLTETDVPTECEEILSGVELIDNRNVRPAKKRLALTPTEGPGSKDSPRHPRVLAIISDEVTDDDPSDDECYTRSSRSNIKKKTPKRKFPAKKQYKSPINKRTASPEPDVQHAEPETESMTRLTTSPKVHPPLHDPDEGTPKPKRSKLEIPAGLLTEESDVKDEQHIQTSYLTCGKKRGRKSTPKSADGIAGEPVDGAPVPTSGLPAATTHVTDLVTTPKRRGRPPGR